MAKLKPRFFFSLALAMERIGNFADLLAFIEQDSSLQALTIK
jgi:hypothetical protein